jgi:hypothetical protein
MSFLGRPSSFEPGHNDTPLTLPVSNEANADHVYRWPIIQQMLDRGLPEAETQSGHLNFQSCVM